MTGYLVERTGNFSTAFIAAGLLAATGGVVSLVLSRGTLGELTPLPVARRAVG